MSEFLMRRLLQRTPRVGGEWSGAGDYSDMPRMTHAEWLAYEARHSKPAISSDGVDRESDLHDEIIEECKQRGWIYFHSRMDRPTTSQVGMPDFIIATTDGRTLYIECKRKGAKCSPHQQAMIHWLERNKQKVAVVYSFQDFLGVCEMEALPSSE